MEELKIVFTELTKGGAFEAFLGTKKVGEVTFAIVPNDYLVIDHTEVFEGHNGKGIGKALVLQAVEHAQINNLKVKPVCPYAVKVFDEMESLKNIRV